MDGRSKGVKEWITRSRACDLSISVHESCDAYNFPRTYTDAIFEAMTEASSRWKHISLDCSSSSFLRLVTFLNQNTPSSCPRLESFSLSITTSLVPRNEDPESVFISSPFATSPRLCDIRLHSSHVTGYYGTYSGPWSQLVYLSLGTENDTVGIDCVGTILAQAHQLRTCKLCLHLDRPRPCPFSCPQLEDINLSFRDDDWWESPESLHYFQNMIVLPVLKHITYDGTEACVPLTGLIRGAQGRITHLSTTFLCDPLVLFECLRLSPDLVYLHVSAEKYEIGMYEDSARTFSNEALRDWNSALDSESIGELLLNAFVPPGFGLFLVRIPETLCPKIEYMSYHDPYGAIYSGTIAKFIKTKCSTVHLANNPQYSKLKGLSIIMLEELPTDDVQLNRLEFADEIDAGLNLSFKYIHRAAPLAPQLAADAGILLNTNRPLWWPFYDESGYR
ncbi:hypothetical protein HYPSUDRAFT_38173 [Hypholoma sublateritium FD-334 SS-4]|uniref:F-box domain-containing protein n=1 Tax=Hypholoma sublateritium (strain FD-334 SS-4) TaxID=945553 RepID=A0A0D2P856_HYPSF|nr:hypothetical protein HYPSUDRAFT_38173 [Hypholoma sublateritium FD-334 SS-4]